jgi:3-isopropylmalate/(R)-2-methylmalate dehydratase small subunit
MTTPFNEVCGIAAPLPLQNIDTDKIIPARFLKTVTRSGLGRGLFHSMRFSDGENERGDFILNREPWRRARILIALDNFGCGSSREHAPWALTDFGIRCIIAPSFADIFYNNCFRNGLLPITIDSSSCLTLIDEVSVPESAEMAISLEEQVIRTAGGKILHFGIPPDRKRQLALGLDEIELTLTRLSEIIAFEAACSSGRAAVPSIPSNVGDEASSARRRL